MADEFAHLTQADQHIAGAKERMSRAQLREFMALFVIGSALTVAVFFLALWLLPEQPFIFFSFPRLTGLF
jgi:hypothetical protein